MCLRASIVIGIKVEASQTGDAATPVRPQTSTVRSCQRTSLRSWRRKPSGPTVQPFFKVPPSPRVQVSGVVVCEGGVTLQRLDDYLRPRGFMVPLDLGAKDTAALGGNVATNAGRHFSMPVSVLHALYSIFFHLFLLNLIPFFFVVFYVQL